MSVARRVLGALLLVLAAASELRAQDGLDTGWTIERCAAPGTDADADGLDDACELALAVAFAPELLADARD